MKIKFIFFLLLIFLSFSIYSTDLTSHFIFKTNFGYIDWSNGKVIIFGKADIPKFVKNSSDISYKDDYNQPRSLAEAKIIAKREAKKNALFNAKKMFLSICVDSERRISDFMNNPEINKKINNFIEFNYKTIDIAYKNNSILITFEYNLFGENGFISLNNSDNFDNNFVNFEYEKFVNYPKTNIVAYDGFVISAPDLKITPALSPKVYAENGNLIYDSSKVYKKYAVKTGVVIYGKTPYNLIKDVNLKFYHCSALRTTFYNSCDIVISNEDAEIILSNLETIQNLKKAKVIILASDKKE